MASGDLLVVYITHVEDGLQARQKPCLTVWGQKERNVYLHLEKALTDLARIFAGNPPPLSAAGISGQVVAVLHNNVWMRGRVGELVNARGPIDIFCMDLGIIQSFPLSMVRSLECLASNPEAGPVIQCRPLAERYVLADVVSVQELWSDSAIRLAKAIMENRMLKAVSLGGGPVGTGLRLYTEKDELVAKMLIEAGMGSPTGSYGTKHQPQQAGNPGHANQSAKADRSNHHSNVAINSNGVPVFPAIQSQPPPSSSGSARAYTAPDLKRGEICEVNVTHLELGPRKFSIQKTESLASLERLRQQLDSVVLRSMKNCERGMPCLALFSQERLLHRGLITYSRQGASSVYYVDFGYSEQLDNRFIFDIPDELLQIPIHSYRVALTNIELLENVPGALELFEAVALSKTFLCHLVELGRPPKVMLFDPSGQSIIELVLAQLSGSRNLEPVSRFPVEPAAAPPIVRLEQRAVQAQERLFVTWVQEAGGFFGQFEKLPVEELIRFQDQLESAYQNVEKPPLLYADVCGHRGHFAVARWNVDGRFYRVQVLDERANDVDVVFVDYGNTLSLAKRHVLSAFQHLASMFQTPPFGIACRLERSSLGLEQWQALVTDKSIHVRILEHRDGVYSVALTDDPINKAIAEALEPPPVSQETVSWNTPPSASHEPAKSVSWNTPPSFNAEPPKPASWNSGPKPEETRKSSYESRKTEPRSMTDRNVPVKSSRIPADHEPSASDDNWRSGSRMNGNERRGQRREEGASWNTGTRSAPSRPFRPDVPPRFQRRSQETKTPLERPLPIVPVVYPTQPVLSRTTKSVQIVHSDGPADFYCHLVEAFQPLDDLMAQLASAYSDGKGKAILELKKGTPCVAQYSEDQGWYRGLVESVMEHEATVFFVDYGNKETTQLEHIKVLEHTFLALPPQAYRCRLAAMEPKENWTQDEKFQFEESLCSRTLEATFIRRVKDGRYLVRLADDQGHLVNETYGCPSVGVPEPQDLEHQLAPLELPDTSVDVTVAWIYHSCRFFLTTETLLAMQAKLEQLDEFYSMLEPQELKETEPSLEHVCVAPFADDGRFYRSRILQINGHVTRVLFVDYGNEQDTPVQDLKRLVPKFATFPPLAIPCRLRGVRRIVPAKSEFQKHETTCFFSSGSLKAVFQAMEPDGVYPVDVTAQNLGDVKEWLLARGVLEHDAVAAEEDDVPVEEKSLFQTWPEADGEYVPGQKLAGGAVVTYYVSSRKFWIQKDPNVVEELMEQIDNMAAAPEFAQVPLLEHGKAGTACLALYNEDERWYRGSVVSNVFQEACLVHYVDYGNTSSVAMEQVRILPSSLMQLERQAIECCLDGLEGLEHCQLERVDQAMEQIYDQLVVDVEFSRYVDGRAAVRLFQDGEDVNARLIMAAGEAVLEHAVEEVEGGATGPQSEGDLPEPVLEQDEPVPDDEEDVPVVPEPLEHAELEDEATIACEEDGGFDVPAIKEEEEDSEHPVEVPEDVPADFPEDTEADMDDVPENVPDDMTYDVLADVPAHELEDVPADVPADELEDVPADVPVHELEDVPADVPGDELEDVPEEIPGHVPEDVPTETPTDVPADSPPAEQPDSVPDPNWTVSIPRVNIEDPSSSRSSPTSSEPLEQPSRNPSPDHRSRLSGTYADALARLKVAEKIALLEHLVKNASPIRHEARSSPSLTPSTSSPNLGSAEPDVSPNHPNPMVPEDTDEFMERDQLKPKTVQSIMELTQPGIMDESVPSTFHLVEDHLAGEVSQLPSETWNQSVARVPDDDWTPELMDATLEREEDDGPEYEDDVVESSDANRTGPGTYDSTNEDMGVAPLEESYEAHEDRTPAVLEHPACIREETESEVAREMEGDVSAASLANASLTGEKNLEHLDTVPESYAFKYPPLSLTYQKDQILSNDARLSNCNGPDDFWLQLDQELVRSIMEQIDELAHGPMFQDLPPIEAVNGQPCLAPMVDEDLLVWQRAVVTKVSGEVCTVSYIDFGSTEPLKVNELKALPLCFAQHPPLAIRCTLDQIDSVETELTKEFEDLFWFSVPVSVRFKKMKAGKCCVRLFDKNQQDLNRILGLEPQ